MTAAKDPSLAGLTACGCCEGRGARVPVSISNRPGLKAVAYRVGTHAQFKESLLARLSSADLPALQQLTTREDGDFTIALLDAWSLVADVLTFYQERIANEAYLRTATERTSVRELAALTGYALGRGVAASAWVAFSVEEPPAAPPPSTSLAVSTALRRAAATVPESVAVAAGTRVQSVPGQDEEAQVFETVEAITARPAWNRMRPRLTQQQTIDAEHGSSVTVNGTSLQLKAGDRLLLRSGTKESLRQVAHVDEDATARTTTIALVPTWALVVPVAPGPLLGAWAALSPSLSAVLASDAAAMVQAASPTTAVAAGPMLGNVQAVLAAGAPAASATLATLVPGALAILAANAQAFAMRARASLFGYNAPAWGLLAPEIRDGIATGVTDWPVDPSSRSCLDLDAVYSQIVPGGRVVIAPGGHPGSPVSATVNAVQDITAAAYGLSAKVTRVWLDAPITIADMNALRGMVVYAQSEELTLSDVPRTDPVEKDRVDLEGRVDGLQPLQPIVLSGELVDPPGTYASELVRVQSATTSGGCTSVSLVAGLAGRYRRGTVTINGNVAPATHGETVSEVLGSGDAAQAFPYFILKQKPLTYLTDSNPSGAISTLEVRVNDILWTEVESLLDSGPEDRHYVVLTDVDGRVRVQFGDGTTGARLPTGQDNVKAVYRKGTGLGGRVGSDQLSLLLTRSYGLKEVTNPLPAEGGDDPETAELARSSAPVKVRTLGRVVSLTDYEDFARGFTGIAKALASWAWFGDRKGVLLTVAQSQGKDSASSSGSTLIEKLGEALRKAGPPFARFCVATYRPATFQVSLRVSVLPDHQEATVKKAVEKALRDAFSFTARSFGQAVYLGEVMACVQQVAGVGGVDVRELYRSGETPARNDRLTASIAETGPDGSRLGAELLTLHQGALAGLGVMP